MIGFAQQYPIESAGRGDRRRLRAAPWAAARGRRPARASGLRRFTDGAAAARWRAPPAPAAGRAMTLIHHRPPALSAADEAALTDLYLRGTPANTLRAYERDLVYLTAWKEAAFAAPSPGPRQSRWRCASSLTMPPT